jgi:hypothetical protein
MDPFEQALRADLPKTASETPWDRTPTPPPTQKKPNPSTMIQYPNEPEAKQAAGRIPFDEALRRAERPLGADSPWGDAIADLPEARGRTAKSLETAIQFPDRPKTPPSGSTAPAKSTLMQFPSSSPAAPPEPTHTIRAFPSADAPIAHSVSSSQTVGPGATMVQYPPDAAPVQQPRLDRPAQWLSTPTPGQLKAPSLPPPPPPEALIPAAPAPVLPPEPPAPSLARSAWEETARGRMVDLGPAHGTKDDALGLVHMTPPPRTPRPEDQRRLLLSRAKDLLDLADHTGALEVAEKILALDPENPEAKQVRERCRVQLLSMYESKLGKLDRRPKVAVKSEEVVWLNLDHRAGFVLSQVDGGTTFEQIFSLSGMSRLDTAKILVQLVEQKVISAP